MKIKVTNPDRPQADPVEFEEDDPQVVGQRLVGMVQAAADFRGNLIIEVRS